MRSIVCLAAVIAATSFAATASAAEPAGVKKKPIGVKICGRKFWEEPDESRPPFLDRYEAGKYAKTRVQAMEALPEIDKVNYRIQLIVKAGETTRRYKVYYEIWGPLMWVRERATGEPKRFIGQKEVDRATALARDYRLKGYRMGRVPVFAEDE